MRSIKDITVKETASIIEVLKIIDKSSKQLALVVDDNNKLLGTISDGDIRRALLKKISLNESVKSIYFKTPTVASINDSREEIINLCKIKKIHQIPILDNKGSLIGIEVLNELISNEAKSNKVILMVGGLGTRLYPLTEKTPKPMLEVGKKPILLTIVEKFAQYGYTDILMCVNHKADVIKDYFGDGTKFGVDIDYIFENKRMGTAGALSLINEKITEPFFVMNGDLLTNVNFEHLHDFHTTNLSMATMCVRDYEFEIPYGVVNIQNTKILSVDEKPLHKSFVNAGIYIFNPEVLQFIPKDHFYDMPTLFNTLIHENLKVVSFPIREYWIDIGRIEELEKANYEFNKEF